MAKFIDAKGKKYTAAGRPKKPVHKKKQRIAVSLSPEICEYLQNQKNTSGFVEELVREFMRAEDVRSNGTGKAT